MKRVREPDAGAVSSPCLAASTPSSWKARVSQAVNLISQKEQLADAAETELRALMENCDKTEERFAKLRTLFGEVVHLNVGGVPFDVPLATLTRDEDSYFHRLLSGSHTVMLDKDGRIFLDRDGQSFRFVLNYLRGYKLNHLTSSELGFLAGDADFYGLPKMKAALGIDNDDRLVMRFDHGPGINFERTRFRGAYAVAPVGDKLFLTGRHTISFQVVQGDYVGVGVVSDSCICLDQEFHRTMNCCVYYMTGVFYSNFPHNRKEEGLEKFQAGDVVTIHLDLTDKTIEFVIKGVSSRVISCSSVTRAKFAVVMKLESEVKIVPTPVSTSATQGSLGQPEDQLVFAPSPFPAI